MADRCLLEAAQNGDIQSLQGLLAAGECDINVRDRGGGTPLHSAASQGHTQCIQLLLQHGADISIQDEDRKTPRMVAAEKEQAAVAELLRRFETPDIQRHVQNRTLEHLADILDHAEYTIINQTNLSMNFPGVLQLQKVRQLKDWAIKNNCKNIRDLMAGLQAANLPRLSSAAGNYYAVLVTEISNMTPDEYEALTRTTKQQDVSLPSDQFCYMYDLFIAYSSEDEATIEPVLHQLKERRVKIWYAKKHLIPGTLVIPSICKAVNASKHTLAFLSKNFVQSQWCQLELQYAMQEAVKSKRDVLIPIVMNISHEEIPKEIEGSKYIFFGGEEFIPKLLQAIKGPKALPTYGQLRDEVKVLRNEVQQLTFKFTEVLYPAESTVINPTNLSTNFPGVFLFQKVQELKDWAIKNNCTNIRNLRVALHAPNLPRLSCAAVDYFAEVVRNILNMPSDILEEFGRTQITARHMCETCSTTTNQQETLSSMDHLRYDAFIAHSSKDRAIVEPVIEQLEELGVKCCYGVRDFHPGKSLVTSMGEAVYGSNRTVVFLSKSFMKSPWCAREMSLAMQKTVESREDVVIPIFMDIPPEQIPDEFKHLKYIPVEDKELIPKLVQTIKGQSESQTNGELIIALQNAREENAFLRDQNRELKAKLHPQFQ